MDHTVRLSISLWDKGESVRMSVHRQVADDDVLGTASEILTDILPAFRRPHDKKLKARVGGPSQGAFLRRRRPRRKAGKAC